MQECSYVAQILSIRSISRLILCHLIHYLLFPTCEISLRYYYIILFQTNVGILAMLDEECLRPGTVTDTTFLTKLNVACCNHAHYESRGCRKTQSDRSLPHDAFKLIHYAGAVRLHPVTPHTFTPCHPIPLPKFHNPLSGHRSSVGDSATINLLHLRIKINGCCNYLVE